MRIVSVRERSIPISRYADPGLPPGGLTTSLVALTTDVIQDGRPVTGYGFSSIGRFGQSGLIRERFAPRLLAAPEDEILDPFQSWAVMMRGEKPGGHGERCVAVGTLDMAVWDAAAKIAGLPLHRYLASRTGGVTNPNVVPVYAGGGYPYPSDDLRRLRTEVSELLDLGYERVKIKVGAAPVPDDLRRIEAVLALLPPGGGLAVDAMNAYGPVESRSAAAALEPLRLWWFEDICDPLDFEALAAVAAAYRGPIAAGEALFSDAEARLLDRYGGLRPDRDVLLFDPVHCYGLPGFLRIVHELEARGWPRSAFWPHGGHLFCQHIVAALGLGGAEVNPLCFHPVGGLSDGQAVHAGCVEVPEAPGIGFEMKAELYALFRELPEA